jgi:2-polyprenyl-3-methyl-5-hydroxy-6-metoxy-1,4-benzoquinol methylase
MPPKDENEIEREAVSDTIWGEHRLPQEAEVYFDSWICHRPQGDTYDECTAPEYYFGPEKIAAALLTRLAPGSDILDVGCGTGNAGIPFISAGHVVVGVDISDEALKKARINGYDKTLKLNLALVEQIAPSNSVDAVVCVGVLDEWLRSDVLIEKLIAPLRKKASIGLTLNEMYSKSAYVIAALKGAGFSIHENLVDKGWHHPNYDAERFHYVVASRS